MSKKLKKKTSAILMASILAMSSIPMASSLPVYAANYVGAGTGGFSGATGGLGKLGIGKLDYGVRIYCIDKESKQIKTSTSGQYIVDLWNDTASSSIMNAEKYGTICRFGEITPKGGTINSAVYMDTFTGGIDRANNKLHSIKLLPESNSIAYMTDFASASTSLNMSGTTFATWAETSITNTTSDKYYQIALLYYGITGIPIETSDYLVIEPILYLPVDVNDKWSEDASHKQDFSGYKYHMVATWYGFVKELGNHGGNFQLTTKDSWGNSFILDEGIAGLSAVAPYTCTDKRIYGTVNEVGNNGWGLHVMEVDPVGKPDPTKDPIDTYNIDQDPKEPYKPEEPKITTNPDNPDNPDTPDFDNTGEKTIIKTYVDLYKDADNNTYYTKATDQGTYIEKNTSNRVVITDESDVNGGYEVVAWYTSSTETTDYTTDELHGTDMLQRTNKADSIHQSIGQELFTVDGYTSIPNISSTGSQSYTYINPTAPNSLSSTDNAKQYTKTTDTLEPIQKNEENQYNTDEYIDLGTDNTIVLLYVREHGWINTDTFTGGGTNHGTGGGNNTSTGTGNDTPDNDNPEQGELKIVKAYGIVNPATHEITNDKNTETIDEVTRNVHITSEPGYRLAEYVYSTRGNATTQWNEVTAESWGQLDTTNTTNQSKTDTSFYLKGFVDGFSEPYGSSLYSSKYAWTDTETTIDSLSPDTSSIITDLTYPGTYGTGRLSGNQLTNYNSTIYFDMPEPDNIEPKNTDTTDDVLYILFLKEDEVEYTADNFIIPESFITRHNDFATNNITVTGNLTGETTSYLFAKHKFKYSLPLVTGLSEEEGNSITAWTDPYIIASISQTNTATTSGLISKWSKTELITYNPTDDTIDKRTSTDNNYELAVKKEQTTAGILSFTNANYSYTAYRKDDKPTLAQWKLEQLGSLSADSTYSMDTSIVNLNTWIQGTEGFKGIDDWNTEICSYSNELAGNRQPNDTTNNFSLPMQFTDTKATGNGVEITIN